MIVIVGPSGSGKDTLIKALRQKTGDKSRCLFIRRVITRAGDPATEDHVCVSEEEFARSKKAGNFAVTWNAHGLNYAIPNEAAMHVERGGIAIANGSRRALEKIKQAFPSLAVINITVEPEVMRQRLHERGRESAEEIEARLKYASLGIPGTFDVHEINNSGSIDSAVGQLTTIINTLVRQ